MTVVVCSSAAFYKHVCEIQDELSAQGLDVVIPRTAQIMRESGDFDVANYKTWYKDESTFKKKQELMDGHFAEIEKGDAILVVNDEKHGVPGYIGPNVLMEIAVAYFLKKKIYVLNDVAKDQSLYEEIKGIEAIELGGNVSNIL